MKTIFKITLFVSMIVLAGCVKNNLDTTTEEESNMVTDGPMQGMNVSDDFSYSTTQQVQVNLSVPTFLKNAVVNLYSKTGTGDSLNLGKVNFDSNGNFSRTITLSAATDSLLIFSQYVGLVKEVRLGVNGDQVNFDYNQFYGDNIGGKTSYDGGDKLPNGFYTYLSTFNSQGVPTVMASNDAISSSLLNDINASLPESAGGIPNTHPEYLAGKETEIILVQQAEVWITFVSEGAGNRNSLGYYTYTLGQEPTSVSQINAHYIVFPNASMQGSGGGLVSGNRVYLGNFPANTVISWFLVANGWTGSTVKETATRFYANPDFNPETNVNAKQHMVLLHDGARNLNIFGFEDLYRGTGGSDDDFNDAVFYVKSNPVTAIATDNVAVLDAANDTDNDGVTDALDEYPNDVNKAFNNYYPSQNGHGTLVFEDLWPSTGDYDFNDLVANYHYNLITNGSNKVTQLKASYTINHIGASFHNGLAFVLPVSPSTISGITGQVLNASYISTNANGTEQGTGANESVIMVAGDTKNMVGQTVDVTINFSTPVSVSALGNAPYNSFIIVNGEREREVHLPDFAPTSKGSGLGTGNDDSNAAISRYYKTYQNLPWALNIFDDFVAPAEKTPITSMYAKFIIWANSGGTLEKEWYKN